MGAAILTASSSIPSLSSAQADLFRKLMRAAPFQPATNLWRAIEIPVLAGALPASGAALDIGCGDGVLTRLVRELAGADWQLIGVDPDTSEAAAARAVGIYQRVHSTPADSINEPDGTFDVAFANSVLEHIPNLPDCLREIGRCLRPGGLFAATVPSPKFRELLRGPGRWARQTRADYVVEIDRRLAHVNYWPADHWRAELATAGFDAPSFTSYLSERQVRRWEAWSHWTGGLLYRLHRRRRQPIAIQRSLGLRRAMPRAFAPLADQLAAAVGRGVLDRVEDRVQGAQRGQGSGFRVQDFDGSEDSVGACWLIVARKCNCDEMNQKKNNDHFYLNPEP